MCRRVKSICVRGQENKTLENIDLFVILDAGAVETQAGVQGDRLHLLPRLPGKGSRKYSSSTNDQATKALPLPLKFNGFRNFYFSLQKSFFSIMPPIPS